MSAELEQEIVRAVAARGDTLPPLDAVVRALEVAADTLFEDRRAAVTRRHAIVAADPELLERELHKDALLTEAIAAALHERGCDPVTAFLAAGTAMLAQQTAFQKWAQPGETRTLPRPSG